MHHLLMAELKFPIVATSGNLSDEPICMDEIEALERLGGIADLFLVHNRPIVRHVDDSIVRVVLDREMILRRARGYAPLPITLGSNYNTQPILAVGAHLKNSVALAIGENIFISQHIGDLETEQANNAFRRTTKDLPKLYEAEPQIIAADLHPDYLSTQFARACKKNIFGVQHHLAHVLSCIAENEVALPALGVSWDGTGFGTDGTIWGGEFFLVTKSSVQRVAHLRSFRLPGSDAAIKEPRRSAVGLLYEIFGDATFDKKELAAITALSPIELSALKGMLQRKLNSPPTSSAGRLFDAVASLIGVRQIMRFEGQAAMELEFALEGIETSEAYHLEVLHGSDDKTILDWQPVILEILD
ncbi:MAG TPA: Sua5/YciO/YrdC/YwlC family protein, partial [Candidatus Baltobacteraceae bacterium]|nr:Sua5/YciO/YrdC/YwlC family protein [Candidatus Baltobacteraceae bacterium]